MPGLIQIYTGNGKGKTTAALGLAMRAVGAGLKVAWVAFDKGGEGHYSERKLILGRCPEIKFYATGLDRIDSETKRFRFGVTEEDKKEGERGLGIVAEVIKRGEHNVLVLDEINSSTTLGIVDEARVLEMLANKTPELEVIMTGRDAPKAFLDRADLITEMKLVEHYFYHGVSAREGLDY